MVVIFVGDLVPLNAKQRRQGVIDELDDRPIPADTTNINWTPQGDETNHLSLGKKVKYTVYGKTWLDQPEGESKASSNAREALGKGDIKKAGHVCLVGLWAYNPPALLSAVQSATREEPDIFSRVKIVGFDENETTLNGVRDDKIVGTVVQQPYKWGYESVKLMVALSKGDDSKLPKNGINYVPYRIITREAGLELPGETKSEAVEPFRAELNKMLGK